MKDKLKTGTGYFDDKVPNTSDKGNRYRKSNYFLIQAYVLK